MYLLKKNVSPFEVVAGPMSGRRFEHGITYEQIPENETKRFDTVKATKNSKAKDSTEVTENA